MFQRYNMSFTSLALIMGVGPVALAAGDEQASIDRVVVFADRAEVTRGVSVNCTGERREIVIGSLPTTLDLRTLRAEASGKATPLGLTSEVVPVDMDRDKRRGELLAALQKSEDHMVELQDRIRNEQERDGNAQAYGALFGQILAEELRSPKPSPEAWRKALTLLESERSETKKRLVAVLAETRKLAREQAQLATKLGAFDGTAPKEARTARVAIACNGEQHPRVSVAYVVPGATWHPEYDLRFVANQGAKVGKGRVELTVGAVIQQATGEDWDNAAIALSTAKPRLGADAPEPAAIYLDGYATTSGQVMVQGTEDRSQLQAGGPGGQAGPKSASLDDGGKSFTLSLPDKATVLSDGRPYWVPVDQVGGAAESFLTTIPKLSPYVYQALRTKNPASYPLLAGRVHVHRGGSYVGDTSTPYVAPGEPMEVSLGLDEELIVERIDVKSMDRQPGIFGSKLKLERALAIKLTNRAKGSERIEVREQLPVSKDERIEVELDDKTSKGASVDKLRGIVTWVVEVPKGAEKRIDFAYRILLPKSWKM